MRGGRSPHGWYENLQNILKIVVGESGEEFTPNDVSSSRSLFCATDLRAGTIIVMKSTSLLYNDAKGEKGSCTEHTFDDCLASEEGNTTPGGSLQAQIYTNKWRYIYLSDPSLFDINAWKFPMEAYAGAPGRLGKQRAISPEG